MDNTNITAQTNIMYRITEGQTVLCSGLKSAVKFYYVLRIFRYFPDYKVSDTVRFRSIYCELI
jgi:hypothetical protein